MTTLREFPNLRQAYRVGTILQYCRMVKYLLRGASYGDPELGGFAGRMRVPRGGWMDGRVVDRR